MVTSTLRPNIPSVPTKQELVDLLRPLNSAQRAHVLQNNKIVRVHPETTINLLEILSRDDSVEVKQAAAKQLNVVPMYFKLSKEHRDRLVQVAGHLIYDGDTDDLRTRVLAAESIVALFIETTPENRIFLLKKMIDAIQHPVIDTKDLQLPPRFYVGVRNVLRAFQRNSARTDEPISHQEQEAFFNFYKQLSESTDRAVLIKALGQTGRISFLCPDYLDEFLALYKSYFDKSAEVRGYLTEEVADTTDFVLRAILRTSDNPDVLLARLEIFNSILDGLRSRSGEMEYGRKKLAYHIHDIVDILDSHDVNSDEDVEEALEDSLQLCGEIIEEFKNDPSRFVRDALIKGEQRSTEGTGLAGPRPLHAENNRPGGSIRPQEPARPTGLGI